MTTTSKISLLHVSMLCFSIIVGAEAHAQDSGENPAAAFFDLSTINEQEGIFVTEDANSTDPAEEDTSLRAMDGDPCPKPRRAFNETPNDLKLIQEDITRFTLCVQRAQLLERLNELAIENTDTIDSALTSNIESVAAQFAPELPDIPIPQAPETPQPNVSSPMTSAPQPTERPMPEWEIRELSGASSNLKATLVNSSNRLVTVKKGDKLPDSDLTVMSIGAMGVTVKGNDETMTLSWKE